PRHAAPRGAGALARPAPRLASLRAAGHASPVDGIAPGLLIAMPRMGDPNFERSVIMMVEHGEGGAMGIAFNRPGSVTVEQIARAHGFPCRPGAGPVLVGGPVDRERGFLIHRLALIEDAIDLGGGVRLSG